MHLLTFALRSWRSIAIHHTRPTELDALVYGHLSAILDTPMPDDSLAACIKEHEKLVELCTRIKKTYFEGMQ